MYLLVCFGLRILDEHIPAKAPGFKKPAEEAGADRWTMDTRLTVAFGKEALVMHYQVKRCCKAL